MMMSAPRTRAGSGSRWPAVGIAQAGLEAAVGYARERRQFGKAVAEFQGLQFLLADMAKDIQAARLLTLDAAAAGPGSRPWPARWPGASPRTWPWHAVRMRCRSSAAAATSKGFEVDA